MPIQDAAEPVDPARCRRDAVPTLDQWRLFTALQAKAEETLVLIRPDGTSAASNIFGQLDPIGFPVGSRIGHHIAERLHPEDLPAVLEALERGRRSPGLDQTVMARCQHADGRWLTFHVTAINRCDDPILQGHVLRIRAIHTEVVAAPREEAEDGLTSLAEAVPLSILSADANGYVVYANAAAQQLLDLPLETLCGSGWLSVVETESLADLTEASANVLAHSERENVTFGLRRASGVSWCQATLVPLRAGGTRTGWIATIHDVTERRRREAELAFRATHDALTELPNRYLLADRLGQAIVRRARDETALTVLYIDIDEFKTINDRFGHATGDLVLEEVVRRLRTALRSADTLARVGGDEFVAVCEATRPDEPATIVQRIREVLAGPALLGGARVTMSASVGIATSVGRDEPPEALVARADEAMYRDKASGRGRAAG